MDKIGFDIVRKNFTLDIEHWPERSEIKNMNSKGPSIEPCGIPLEMDFCVEKVESTRTLKV